jgi:hypothetical protein
MRSIGAFALIALATCLMPLRSASADWQCGRDYIVGTGLYGLIYRHQTGPYGEAEDVWLNPGPPVGSPAWDRIQNCKLNPGPPVGSPAWDRIQNCKTDRCMRRQFHNDYLWENYGRVSADKADAVNRGRLYYRGKPCKEIPALSEPEQKSVK